MPVSSCVERRPAFKLRMQAVSAKDNIWHKPSVDQAMFKLRFTLEGQLYGCFQKASRAIAQQLPNLSQPLAQRFL